MLDWALLLSLYSRLEHRYSIFRNHSIAAPECSLILRHNRTTSSVWCEPPVRSNGTASCEYSSHKKPLLSRLPQPVIPAPSILLIFPHLFPHFRMVFRQKIISSPQEYSFSASLCDPISTAVSDILKPPPDMESAVSLDDKTKSGLLFSPNCSFFSLKIPHMHRFSLF